VYELFAVHPRLKRNHFETSRYYGLAVTSSCMSREAARQIVGTATITPE
jgi:hypothetical protein